MIRNKLSERSGSEQAEQEEKNDGDECNYFENGNCLFMGIGCRQDTDDMLKCDLRLKDVKITALEAQLGGQVEENTELKKRISDIQTIVQNRRKSVVDRFDEIRDLLSEQKQILPKDIARNHFERRFDEDEEEKKDV